jgi:hypothetical protein
MYQQQRKPQYKLLNSLQNVGDSKNKLDNQEFNLLASLALALAVMEVLLLVVSLLPD